MILNDRSEAKDIACPLACSALSAHCLERRGAALLKEERLMSVGQDEFEVTTDRNEGLVMEMDIDISCGQ